MYYFVVNPGSGCGTGHQVWKKVKKYLELYHVEYVAYLTQGNHDATRFVKELTENSKQPHIIIVVGGDGTVNEVLDGLDFSGTVTLGYIPASICSDLARGLCLPKNPKRCIKKILYPKYYKMLDYGVLTYGQGEIFHRRFAVSAGMGQDAVVCKHLLPLKAERFLNRLHMGRVVCLLISCRQLLLAKPSKGYLLLDGTRRVEFNHINFVSAHIHPYEGGGFQFAPKADATDGKLTLCVAFQPNKRKMIPLLLQSFFKKHGAVKGIRTYECTEAEVHTERPMAVHVDGESCFLQTDIQIHCIPSKMRMVL